MSYDSFDPHEVFRLGDDIRSSRGGETHRVHFVDARRLEVQAISVLDGESVVRVINPLNWEIVSRGNPVPVGPVVDVMGRVIGVSTARAGFSVPVPG